MQSKLTIAVLCGFLLMGLAACGGGGDGARVTELETDLAAEQEAREGAEAQAAEAERKRQEEEAARKEAEAEAAEAEGEIEDAKDDAAKAERLRQEEEEKRQAAEAAQKQLETAAEEVQKAVDTERARVAISGTRILGAAPVVGTIKYGEPAPVTTPLPPFTTTTGRSGRWSTTSLTAHAEPMRDMIEIYSDVEEPKGSAFATSDYNTDNKKKSAVIDGTGKVVHHVDIKSADPEKDDPGHSRIVASGSFPSDSGPPEPFALVDRGLIKSDYDKLNLKKDGSATDSDLESAGITRQQYEQYSAKEFRDMDDFPERYAYTTSGSLQGASGTYRCSGRDKAATCTVQNNGGSFTFGDGEDWDFIPSSGTVQIVVPDGQYMWFGVWAQQTVRIGDSKQPTEIWEFKANHDGTARVTNLGAATGSATYQGPAAGRYAIYEPDTGESGIGSFTASATLVADFDSSPNTVSGVIKEFSDDLDWSLALKRKNIGQGLVKAEADEASVTWTIDGVPDDSGAWEAQFYANLPTDEGTITYQPHGIAGTFKAAYDPSGVGARAAVIGGFGAHR